MAGSLEDRSRGMGDAAPGADPREAMLALVPQMRGFARSLARDHDEADDLVQDALMLALDAWHRFVPGTNLKAWLFTIMRNRFLTVRARRHVTAEVGVTFLERLASVPATQEGHAELHDFKAAFARLGPSHREVLVLYGVHGLPYDEIARICGCEVGSVKSRMNRARNALKRMLLEDRSPPVPRKRRNAGVARAGSASGREPAPEGPEA